MLKIFRKRLEVEEEARKKLECDLQVAKANNIVLLENAEYLREQLKVADKKIKSLEDELNSLREASFEGAKKKAGRPKKIKVPTE